MTEPMTDERLAEITTNAAYVYEHSDYSPRGIDAGELAGTDVPALLAEVHRLRAEAKAAHLDAYWAAAGGLKMNAAWRSARRRANRYGYQRAEWLARNQQLDDEVRQLRAALAEPRLPVLPDGTHWYVCTYCVHGNCAACRRHCKSCPSTCQCGGDAHAPVAR